MKYITKTMMFELIEKLRAIAPKRPLSYGESLQVARIQAARVRAWLDSDEPDINLIWLRQQRAIAVNFVPSYRLGSESGLTTNEISGHLEIYINEQEPRQRQRFTILHELKHALDFRDASLLHSRLGSGNARRQAYQIEMICNEFAGLVLMPTPLVKRAWFQSQDIDFCATLFNVSAEAMSKRLSVMGLIGQPQTAPRTYFRRTGLLSYAA